MMDWIRDLAQWVVGFADSGHGTLALFWLAFAESSFFPIPPDVLLIALGLGKPEAWLLFAAVCTVGSAMGGLFGYALGYWGGRPLLYKLFKAGTIHSVEKQFQRYDVWAIFIAGFTPIPYKVFTLSAGACALHPVRFFIASILGRGARFFLVGAAVALLGERAKPWLKEYFDIISIVFVVLLVAGFVLVGKWANRSAACIGERTNERQE